MSKWDDLLSWTLATPETIASTRCATLYLLTYNIPIKFSIVPFTHTHILQYSLLSSSKFIQKMDKLFDSTKMLFILQLYGKIEVIQAYNFWMLSFNFDSNLILRSGSVWFCTFLIRKGMIQIYQYIFLQAISKMSSSYSIKKQGKISVREQ